MQFAIVVERPIMEAALMAFKFNKLEHGPFKEIWKRC
jgi:hypothetical protein